MKLYEVPRNTRVYLSDGTPINFEHIDGMYSYCTTTQGDVVHIGASTEVTLEDPTK